MLWKRKDWKKLGSFLFLCLGVGLLCVSCVEQKIIDLGCKEDGDCKGKERCREKQCVCDAPNIRCQGDCVLLFNDANHCGQCGQACPSGNLCAAGACCTPTEKACDGKDNDCDGKIDEDCPWAVASNVYLTPAHTVDSLGRWTFTRRRNASTFGIPALPDCFAEAPSPEPWQGWDNHCLTQVHPDGNHRWSLPIKILNPESYSSKLDVLDIIHDEKNHIHVLLSSCGDTKIGEKIFTVEDIYCQTGSYVPILLEIDSQGHLLHAEMLKEHSFFMRKIAVSKKGEIYALTYLRGQKTIKGVTLDGSIPEEAKNHLYSHFYVSQFLIKFTPEKEIQWATKLPYLATLGSNYDLDHRFISIHNLDEENVLLSAGLHHLEENIFGLKNGYLAVFSEQTGELKHKKEIPALWSLPSISSFVHKGKIYSLFHQIKRLEENKYTNHFHLHIDNFDLTPHDRLSVDLHVNDDPVQTFIYRAEFFPPSPETAFPLLVFSSNGKLKLITNGSHTLELSQEGRNYLRVDFERKALHIETIKRFLPSTQIRQHPSFGEYISLGRFPNFPWKDYGWAPPKEYEYLLLRNAK